MSNNNFLKILPPFPWDAKIILLDFFESYGDIDIYVWKSYLIIKKIKFCHPLRVPGQKYLFKFIW